MKEFLIEELDGGLTINDAVKDRLTFTVREDEIVTEFRMYSYEAISLIEFLQDFLNKGATVA